MFSWSIDEDIELRILEIRHVPELFTLTDGNRKHLVEWLPWVRETHSAADTERFVRAALRQFADGDGFHAGIWYQGELSGAIGLHRIDWFNRNVSLGYWVSADRQGKGLATAATSAVVEYSFTELDLHRVEIRCGLENHKSRAIPQKLGFRQEGVLRAAQWLGDRWTDIVVYGRLATDPMEDV